MLYTLSDLCELIHEATGIHPVTCRVVARKLFAVMKDKLKEQSSISIEDFGKFTFKRRKATIHSNLSGGPDTYSPANSKLLFKPDRHWENWQRVNSSVIPDELPDGTALGQLLGKSHRIRSEYPQHAAENNSPFYKNVIVPRAIRKSKK